MNSAKDGLGVGLSSREADHVGTLTLRRYRAGELDGAARAALETRLAADATLRGRLRALDEEQSRFEQEVSFERFAGGVERARRVPATRPVPRRAAVLTLSSLGLAAAAALLLFVRPPADDPGQVGNRGQGSNRLKGHTSVVIRIAPADGRPQREARATDTLAPGDRLRIGYTAKEPVFVVALSIDEQGVVSPIFSAGPPADARSSSALPPSASDTGAVAFLPEAFELFGAGQERVYVVTSREPMAYNRVKSEVERAFTAARRLDAMPARLHSGDPASTSFLFHKP
jgi:hypothetical protein